MGCSNLAAGLLQAGFRKAANQTKKKSCIVLHAILLLDRAFVSHFEVVAAGRSFSVFFNFFFFENLVVLVQTPRG